MYNPVKRFPGMVGWSLLLFILSLAGCAAVRQEGAYKNPDVVIFHANKVLVVGMAPDAASREKFETALRDEFLERGVEAVRSIDLFDVVFSPARQSEEELDEVEYQLLDQDFDAILFTKLLDVETRQSLQDQIRELGKTYDRFREDYLLHQGIYYNLEEPGSPEVYYAETSLYCICVGKERDLIWRSNVRIKQAYKADRVIRAYVDLLVRSMEEEQLVIGPAFR